MTIPVRIKRMDSLFSLIGDQIGFSAITPINVEKERKTFIKNKGAYNPQFEYEKIDETFDDYKHILKEMSFGETTIEKLYDQRKKELIKKIELLQQIGSEKFSTTSMKLYKGPEEELVKTAYSILQLPPSSKAKKIPRREAITLLRKVFNALQLKYTITSIGIITSANVSTEKRLLELKKRERFSEDYTKRLIVHEIGTHVLRTENGLLQELKIFRTGFPDYIETEEGIAAYNEYRTGLMTNSILRNYAGRVIAVHYALVNDFMSTYKHLRKFFQEKTAWKLTLRAKRGIGDTAQKGAYTKDAVYLRGFLKILKFTEQHDIAELYVGKIGIQHVSLLEKDVPCKTPTHYISEIFAQQIIEPSARRINEEELQLVLQGKPLMKKKKIKKKEQEEE